MSGEYLDVSETGVAVGSGTERILVEPDKLLDAAVVVARRADALDTALSDNAAAVRAGAPSDNRICVLTTEAWNTVVADGDQTYLARAQAYLRGLRDLERQLRRVAERYRVDDDASSAVFRDGDGS